MTKEKRSPQKPASHKKYCLFCVKNVNNIDYKDTGVIKRYVSSYGKIVSKKRSGVCAKHQRALANAIKRARIVALLPFTTR
ncbi:MAG: 30S ribosomal protein S18 [uncultured bacterium]|nr:MAG: 30S ribosomal protein S18 [uncultured bacterium]HBD05426.1 30S ribosomal protein S18 [Candidatus Uhrbacteria bacterium]